MMLLSSSKVKISFTVALLTIGMFSSAAFAVQRAASDTSLENILNHDDIDSLFSYEQIDNVQIDLHPFNDAI